VKFIPELKKSWSLLPQPEDTIRLMILILNGAIPKLVYGNNNNKWSSKYRHKRQCFSLQLVVDDIQTTNSNCLTLYFGKVQDNTANYTLQLKDLKDKERYLISGTLKASAEITNFLTEKSTTQL
jgi:hypothetical protein